MMSPFGKYVAKRLIDLDVPRKALAVEAGISNGFLSLMLSGKRKPSPKLIAALRAVGLDDDEFEVELVKASGGVVDVSGLGDEDVRSVLAFVRQLRDKKCRS